MECRAETLSFIKSAPYRFENEGIMPVSAEKLFAALADTPSWPRWFDDMHEAHWTSAAPYGVGSTRTVKLTPMLVDERILVFEPGKQFAMRIERVGLPLIKAMVEDFQIDALGPDSSRLRWVAAYEPALLMKAIHPIARAIFGGQFRRTVEQLAKYLGTAR